MGKHEKTQEVYEKACELDPEYADRCQGEGTSTLGARNGFERRGGPLVIHGEIPGENSANRAQKKPIHYGPGSSERNGKCILLISNCYIKFRRENEQPSERY